MTKFPKIDHRTKIDTEEDFLSMKLPLSMKMDLREKLVFPSADPSKANKATKENAGIETQRKVFVTHLTPNRSIQQYNFNFEGKPKGAVKFFRKLSHVN